jgi:hypothetical protein
MDKAESQSFPADSGPSLLVSKRAAFEEPNTAPGAKKIKSFQDDNTAPVPVLRVLFPEKVC